MERIPEELELMALNAIIEAVRAGEAGNRFAVVSHEAKKSVRRFFNKFKELPVKRKPDN